MPPVSGSQGGAAARLAGANPTKVTSARRAAVPIDGTRRIGYSGARGVRRVRLPPRRSAAGEVGGVVRVAAPVVGRMLRLRTQRTRPRRDAFAHLRRDDALRRVAVFDPVDDRGSPVRGIGTWAADTMEDAGHHEETIEIANLGVTLLNLLVVLDRRERRQTGV